MPCTDEPSPNGTFSKLPPELRCNIWRFLMPDLRPPFNDEVCKERERRYVDGKCDLYPNRLSVLRTSRALYEEVSCELYRPELCFCVCPNEENVTAKGLPSSSICHFMNTPLDRFCRIAIEIKAPVEDDPEQVLMGRDSVWRVVSLILDFIEERGQRSNHSHQILLPHIDIRLLDRSCATWFDLVANNWQRSIPGYSEEDDIDFFLSPFGSVRGVGCVYVHLPHVLEDYFSMRELVTGMQLPDEFGTRLHLPHYFDSDQDCDNDCNDDVIFFDGEEKFNKLQDACSFLGGRTVRIVKARKKIKEFDVQTNHQVAPSQDPSSWEEYCWVKEYSCCGSPL